MGHRPKDAERLSESTDLGAPHVGARKRDWPLVVRRARADDKDAVLEFATATWDGWDYIPQAWPVWLAATDGVMLVACRPDSDRPVALTRVAMVSPTEAWLEGIRVDPAVRGMDVASDLQVAELRWAAAQGATVIRYATSAQNEGSHRLGARHGIELLFEYRNYWWSPDPGDDPDDPSGFDAQVRAEATGARQRILAAFAAHGRIAVAGDADRLWRIVANDAGFKAAQQLYEPRPWELGELTAQRFRQHVERGEVITFDDRGIAILLREQLASEDSSLRLALLAGQVDGVVVLLERLRDIADKTVRFRLPLGSPLDAAGHDRLAGAGYRGTDWELHILGRPIDSDHRVPEVDPTRLILAEEPTAVVVPLEF